MADEDLIVRISAPGGKEAVEVLNNLNSRLLEFSEVIKNTGSGSGQFKVLEKEFNSVTKIAKAYSSVIDDINKKNTSTAIGQQKLIDAQNKAAISSSRLNIQLEKESATLQKIASNAERAANPYNKLKNELKDYELKLYGAIAAGKLNSTALAAMGTKYKSLKSNLDTVNTKFKELTGQMNETKNSGMVFASFLGNLAADYIQRVISSLGNMINEISQAGVILDGVANTFAAGARGWKQGGEEMEWVANVADKLGLNLKSTYEPYAKFMTSFTRSGGTLQESRQIFEDLSTAMVSLHLNSSQMENIFVALEQMANKGTVQSEELKRQLGNALPGAFEIAAQSMNVTTAELMDMMKAGEVVSRDFLPKFAALVKDSLGKQIGIAVNQYNAQLNRMLSETFLMRANLGQLWNNASIPAVQSITAIAKATNEFTGSAKDSAAAITLLQTALVALTAATVLFIGKFGIVNTSLSLMKANAIAALNSLRAIILTPIGLTLTAIGGAALYCANSIGVVNRNYEEMSVQQRDVSNNLTGLLNDFIQLSDVTNRSTAQQEAYNRTLESLKADYPTVLQYVQDHKISLTNLTQAQADNIASLAIQQKMQEAQKQKIDELNDRWLIFATRVKQAGLIAVGGLQAVGVGIGHVAVTIEQKMIEVLGSGYSAMGEFTEKIAFVASKIGNKDLAVKFDNATKSLKSFKTVGIEATKVQRDMLNKSLEETAQRIKNLEIERKEKALNTYKDTVATLGIEQAKLAQQLMYTSTALAHVSSGASGKESAKGRSTKSKSSSATSSKTSNEWEALNKEISALEDTIKIRKLNGQSIDDIVPKYVRLKTVQDQINKSVEKLNSIPKTGLEAIKEKAQEATAVYEKMIGNANAFTMAEIKQAAATMKLYNGEVKYYDVLKKRESILQIGAREAKAMAESLVDTIFEPLDEGETLWDRFRDAGISALKAIASQWTKNLMNSMLAGFQTNFSKYAGYSLSDRLTAGLRGAATGAFGLPLTGTKDAPIDPLKGWGVSLTDAIKALMGKTSSSETEMTFLDSLTSKATNLTGVLNTATSPAINTAKTAISGMSAGALEATASLANVASPVLQISNATASMATSAPIASSSMKILGASMQGLAAPAQSTAPSLSTMAKSLGQISQQAANAATSVASLAVSTAALSVAKIPFVGGFLAPAAALATGGGIAAGAALAGAGIGAAAILAGGGQAIGGALGGLGNLFSGSKGTSSSANIIPHAKGGIVTSPTTFPMVGGNIGLAGEAGTEIIAPAKRMANGDLGIGAVQPQVTVNNYTNAAVEVKRRPDNSTEIKIAELNAMLSSSRTNKGMASAQFRMQKSGRQIG